MEFKERIAHSYFFAKHYVIKSGFANEVDWQEDIRYDQLTEQSFLKEISWVILASGLSDKVVKKVYPKIESIMFNFHSSREIYENREICNRMALEAFNHKGKIKAIISVAEFVFRNSFSYVKSQIQEKGVSFIQTFPFMGKATSFHLAKNIGLDVVKPDRHLVRISTILGFKTPHDLCCQISTTIDEKLSIIDLVLWRYATLDKNYVLKLNRIFKNESTVKD